MYIDILNISIIFSTYKDKIYFFSIVNTNVRLVASLIVTLNKNIRVKLKVIVSSYNTLLLLHLTVE